MSEQFKQRRIRDLEVLVELEAWIESSKRLTEQHLDYVTRLSAAFRSSQKVGARRQRKVLNLEEEIARLKAEKS